MLTGARILWRAIVHFWDESLLMMRTNLTWFVVSLPVYLLTVLVLGIFIPPVEPDGEGSFLPWLMAAFMLVTVPHPGSAGVYAIANFVANDETPEFSLFWRAIRMLWKRTIVMYLIGAGVLAGLVFNMTFYMGTPGALQAVAILWVYAMIYWLTMQAYLLPLTLQAAIPPPPPPSADDGWPIDETSGRRATAVKPPPEPPAPEILPFGTLYKRAAILALANPLMSLVMLLGTILALILSSFALPLFPLIVMSYVALIGCRGLRALREKYFPTEAQGAAG
ncbi:MAG: hypothetical protein U0893_15520 [Chloroflexota bacterium]